MNSLTRLAISLSIIGLTCSLPFVATATTIVQASSKISNENKQEVSFLFILRAESGVIAKADEGYTLTLKGIDNKVLYFSDRP